MTGWVWVMIRKSMRVGEAWASEGEVWKFHWFGASLAQAADMIVILGDVDEEGMQH